MKIHFFCLQKSSRQFVPGFPKSFQDQLPRPIALSLPPSSMNNPDMLEKSEKEETGGNEKIVEGKEEEECNSPGATPMVCDRFMVPYIADMLQLLSTQEPFKVFS